MICSERHPATLTERDAVLNFACWLRNAVIPSTKPTAENDDGLCVSLNQGDKTAIELFIAGVRGWEGHLRRLDDGKPAGWQGCGIMQRGRRP
jgi:hypothetical protein